MRVVSIVGTRPQFIKVAPISWRSRDLCEHLIINTGQHYDPELSDDFFKELDIPAPIENLYSGSGNHGEQTAKILSRAEDALLKLKPDRVLVYGDTNSTIAATLASVKLGIKTGHVEAGLRSFNRGMPEEINRVGTDHLSDLLFAPTKAALQNLANEGLEEKSYLVGDVMVETLNYIKDRALAKKVSVSEKIFTTIHRAENTNSKERLQFVISNLAKSPSPIHLYAHPRLVSKAKEFSIELSQGSIKVFKPAGYLKTVTEILESKGVITDSGGLQKEAYLLGRPCLTIRSETEWSETIESGWNVLDPNLNQISNQWWNNSREPINEIAFDGENSSTRILDLLLK
jgi:UDP-N-acetylglucosamine 2-epimerase (non-hydrolysing)